MALSISLSIRDCKLEELPVEIGKLTNLIMLEFWNEDVKLKRISPGVLSKLDRLEELHIMKVQHCSYSTLRELESFSRLTALTLIEYSGDVIYSNLGLPSKSTRYALRVGQQPTHNYLESSLLDKYNRIMLLVVTETTPLGDWICPLLRKSECVRSSGRGSKNVLTELQLDEFQKVKDLCLDDCDSLTHLLKIHWQNIIPFPKLERLEVISCPRLQCIFWLSLAAGSSTVACPDDDEEEEISRRTHIGPEGNMIQVIKFPNLYDLVLYDLECLTHFCTETVEFPHLRKMCLWSLPKFRNFWPTTNNSGTDSSSLFDEEVCYPSLQELDLWRANNISALCSHQLPTAYFSKLEKLVVTECGKLRNLMSPSVARGVSNL